MERGAAGLLGAAGASAVLQLHAWGLAHGSQSLTGAILVAAFALATGLALAAWWGGALRNRAWDGTLRIATSSALILMTVGWLVLRSQWIAPWSIPLVALPCGALLGALVAWRRPSTEQAGRYLDHRFALKERASTAAELMARGKSGEPWAQCVLSQALSALQRERVLDHPVERPRTSMGLAAMAALFCLALMLLPGRASLPADDLGARLAWTLPKMTDRQRQELAEALLKAATDAGDKPAVVANLQDAAKAARQADPAAMQRALELLTATGGIELRKVIPKDLVSGNGAGGPTPTPTSGIAVKTPATGENGPATNPVPLPAANYVRVMNPEYTKVAATGEAPRPSDLSVPWDQAWETARARAMQAVASGQVPARHRELVADFFAGSGQGGRQ